MLTQTPDPARLAALRAAYAVLAETGIAPAEILADHAFTLTDLATWLLGEDQTPALAVRVAELEAAIADADSRMTTVAEPYDDKAARDAYPGEARRLNGDDGSF